MKLRKILCVEGANLDLPLEMSCLIYVLHIVQYGDVLN